MDLLDMIESALHDIVREAARKHSKATKDAKRGLQHLDEIPKADRRKVDTVKRCARSEEILHAFITACSMDSTRLSVLGVSGLQLLASHDAIEASGMGAVLSLLGKMAKQDDEVLQVKVAQALMSIVSSSSLVHDAPLAQILVFTLRQIESKSSMVASIVGATLRQMVAQILDRVAAEDARGDDGPHSSVGVSSTPASKHHAATLRPAALDAYLTLQAFCQLTTGEPSPWLASVPGYKASPPRLSRVMGLELVEFILLRLRVDALYLMHPEYAELLREAVCPMVVRLLCDTRDWPVFLWLMRLTRLLIVDFGHILSMEVEVFVSQILKIIESPSSSLGIVTCCIELAVVLLADVSVMARLCQYYDCQDRATRVFEHTANAISRTIATLTDRESTRFAELRGAAPVALVPSAGALPLYILEPMPSDAPRRDAGYTVMLATNGLAAILANIIALAGDVVLPLPLPPVLTIAPIGSAGASASAAAGASSAQAPVDRPIARLMMLGCWMGAVSALTAVLGAAEDDALVHNVLALLADVTACCSVLSLATQRDAFLAGLCRLSLPRKLAIWKPTSARARLTHASSGSAALAAAAATAAASATTPTAAASEASAAAQTDDETFALAAAEPLTAKNALVLATLIHTVNALADSLGDGWQPVLETLAKLDVALADRTAAAATGAPGSAERSAAAGALDLASMSMTDSRPVALATLRHSLDVFFAADALGPDSFCSMVSNLVRLSDGLARAARPSFAASANASQAIRAHEPAQRGVPGALANALAKRHVARLFGVVCLLRVANANVKRLSLVWDAVSAHLVFLSASHEDAELRAFGVQVLMDLVQAALNASPREMHPALLGVFRRVCASRYSDTHGRALEALLDSLHVMGDTLDDVHPGWPVILDVLGDAVHEDVLAGNDALAVSAASVAAGGGTVLAASPRNQQQLLAVSFRSLQFIVTDVLDVLPKDLLPRFIELVASYARQPVDLNIALTAIGSLWTVADYLKLSTQGSDLWVLLFAQMGALCAHRLAETRNCALRTLFKTLATHGSEMPVPLWERTMSGTLLPLLRQTQLALCTASTEPIGAAALDAPADAESCAEPGGANAAGSAQGAGAGTSGADGGGGGGGGGGESYIIVHHTRDSEAKLWDETLALVLEGVAQILRTYQVLLSQLDGFAQMWGEATTYLEGGICGFAGARDEAPVHASKQVALAAARSLGSLLAALAVETGLSAAAHASVWDDVWEHVERCMSFCVAASLGKTQTSLDGNAVRDVLLALQACVATAVTTRAEALGGSGEALPDALFERIMRLVGLSFASGFANTSHRAESGKPSETEVAALKLVDALLPLRSVDQQKHLVRQLLMPIADVCLALERRRQAAAGAGGASADATTPRTRLVTQHALAALAELTRRVMSEAAANASSHALLVETVPLVLQVLGRALACGMHAEPDWTRGGDALAALWPATVQLAYDALAPSHEHLGAFFAELADNVEQVVHFMLTAPERVASDARETAILAVLASPVLAHGSLLEAATVSRLLGVLGALLAGVSYEAVDARVQRFVLTALSVTCSLCAADVAAPAAVANAAAAVLHEQACVVLRQYVEDDRLAGAKPLPLFQCQLVIRMLCSLRDLTLSSCVAWPGVGAGAGACAHLVALFGLFCQAITATDTSTKEALRDVLLRAGGALGAVTEH